MALPMIFGGAAPPAKYQIEHSARFRSAAICHLGRTLAAPSSRQCFSISVWVKNSAAQLTGNSSTNFCLSFDTGSTTFMKLQFGDTGNSHGSLCLMRYNGAGYDVNTVISPTGTAIRDQSGWYHVVCAVDTNQPSGSRVRFWINGREIAGAGIEPPAGYVFPENVAGATMLLGRNGSWYNPTVGFDGYIADAHFIDGQALSPSAFGRFDENGIWVPIRYTGTYGANGFRLEFKDASNLGLDTSGNGNHWTVNGLTAADRMLDTPSNNYCTLNPLVSRYVSTAPTYSNGNLSVSGLDYETFGSIGASSGRYYMETTIGSGGGNGGSGILLGFVNMDIQSAYSWNMSDVGIFSVRAYQGQTFWPNATASLPSLPSIAVGDVMGLALDFSSDTMTVYRNGSVYQTASGYLAQYPGTWTIYLRCANYAQTFHANFGQSPFTYTPPEGFKTLCTANLPAVSIKKPKDHFNTVLYTGNGGIQAVTGLGFQPGLLWGKQRNSGGRSHFLQNEVVGAQSFLDTDGPGREVSQHENGYVRSFDPDGFTLTAGSTSALTVNQDGGTYVAWAWKGAGAATPNNDGSIASQVSTNPTAGFSIVSFHTDGVSGQTVGHGLGVEPTFTILKARENVTTNHWYVHHRNGCPPSGGTGMALNLDIQPSGSYPSLNSWSSAVLNLRTLSAGNYIAYCFAEIPGYSKFGSYGGNGSSDGPFVHCGFRPRFVMWKRIDSAGSWHIHDSGREPWNGAPVDLVANSSAAEASGIYPFDLLSNGFKVRSNDAEANIGTYIYAAFAEHPFGGSNVSPSPAR